MVWLSWYWQMKKFLLSTLPYLFSLSTYPYAEWSGVVVGSELVLADEKVLVVDAVLVVPLPLEVAVEFGAVPRKVTGAEQEGKA
jgi:hypothetical protein